MSAAESRTPWWAFVLLLPLLAIVLVGVAVWLAAAVVLLLTVWLVWCTRGHRALIVYSNSPVWQQYFEDHILPMVGARGVVLNWSERKRWRLSLSLLLFWCFGGTEEFNPLAIVFRPFSWPRWFRFYRPFKAFKHGRPEQVEEMRRALFRALDVIDSSSPPREV